MNCHGSEFDPQIFAFKIPVVCQNEQGTAGYSA